MTNEVIRGDEIVNEAVSDVYDFNQQGMDSFLALHFIWSCFLGTNHSNSTVR